ncbi:dTDP-4-dehydrorhamnose 3,5-epimerase [Aetokthonos hydrillicola Thurmond2011]|jgi:dTDP-4-dehydrorhamnose 3,5-epimerase-like enzyme|uniref:dTDP-4-dehydrorhamnose 3,5-epimerase n=1 Tax=Aetokthonos hydrillicola Thurmond2011 TaxID=2712845 RepID=A0AAP5IGT1_9CYAN|nr:dTDP-4-dehydrorhamnose 3,5-epimerase [Aetokthonos hydrillicola]MBO3457252.1 dTDP-4-dehydrorhamnose 3,5-epimerase [Aetokthonos hydrillicola CCALA 1050]MBW4586593.1 dTDP-4-dehydrorhamnose 3,5-epimerase [Aetokthonos hydrillicola CCALA 1050]MDR9900132.1 dTDP-4-dehydrorhamnose 3,5-epimerase [Aetokthonos hydrillicola Thurmond2011]
MGEARVIQVRQLESIKGGMAEFFTPQASHETMLVQIPPNALDDLFVHKSQTDQLLVVRGRFVLVTLINRQYQYIPLSEDHPVVVTIPPGVLHGAINLSSQQCVVVNAVLRHRPVQERDYVPRARPFPYDLAAAEAALKELESTTEWVKPAHVV